MRQSPEFETLTIEDLYPVMKENKTEAVIFLALISLTLVIWLLAPGAIEIQLHDDYFIIDKISFVILLVGPITLAIFLTRRLTGRFTSVWTTVGLIVGLLMVAMIIYRVIQFAWVFVQEAN